MAHRGKSAGNVVRAFLDTLPPDFGPQHFLIEEDIELFERLLALEHSQQTMHARLKLLRNITRLAGAASIVNLLLLVEVISASIFLSYQPDEWLVRILAAGPAAAIVSAFVGVVWHLQLVKKQRIRNCHALLQALA